MKLRYEVATGKVNLIVHGEREDEIQIEGMKYMKIDKYPSFDRTKENLYLLNGRLIAIDETVTPPLHRIIE